MSTYDFFFKDLIIQTDDSYLKIARRLNEYRTNKTPTLKIYSTSFNVTTDQKSSPIQLKPKMYLNSEIYNERRQSVPKSPSLRRVNFELDQDINDNNKKTHKSMRDILEPAAERLRNSFR